MDKIYQADNVNPDTVIKLAAQYAYLVPDSLLTKPKRLDKFRYHTLPKLLRQQKREASASHQSKPHLSKDALAKLMDWKLGHGKFRPNLAKLIQQNSSAQVQSTSETAFAIYDDPEQDSVHAFEKLESLRGVGPATASLILSVYDPENVPFFSDELYRWCFWYPGKGLGWDRRIAYSWKQYFDFQYQIEQWLKRLWKKHSDGKAESGEKGIGCIELERAAFVLAKTDGKGLTDEDVAKLDAGEEVRGMKRKFQDDTSEAEDIEQPSVDVDNVNEARTNGAESKAETATTSKRKKVSKPAVPPKKAKKEAKAKSAEAGETQIIDSSLRRSGRTRQTRNYVDTAGVDDD